MAERPKALRRAAKTKASAGFAGARIPQIDSLA